MLIERTENPAWLSNAYLVADEDGQGVLIDGNDTLEPPLEVAERDGIEITHVLLTHVHHDHIAVGIAGMEIGDGIVLADRGIVAEVELIIAVAAGEHVAVRIAVDHVVQFVAGAVDRAATVEEMKILSTNVPSA